MQVWSLGGGDPLEWQLPPVLLPEESHEEPGRLRSIEAQSRMWLKRLSMYARVSEGRVLREEEQACIEV